MKVAVIGAGIVGVTTAYELADDGHEVTVFERRGSVAAEASFANAGIVSPCDVSPWAPWGLPVKDLGQLLGRHPPLQWRPGYSPATIAWLWRWWRASSVRTYQVNRARMQRLAVFSRERMHRVARELKLDCERGEGYLLLLRTAKELAALEPGLAALAELKSRFAVLDAAQCRVVEPGLSDETALHAGIHLPDDEVANCRLFANRLRAEAQRLGARFRFHTEVQRVGAGRLPELVHPYVAPREASSLQPGGAEHAPNDAQDTQPMALHPVTEAFDAIVVCAALGSNALLKPHGVTLPLQAVHGYSITAPLRRHEGHPDLGPRAALLDERHKVAISRLGTRVRVSGGAEVGGAPGRHHAATLDTLHKVLHDWFPGRARIEQAQTWKGARAVLPDGPPVLGPSGIDGVWLNLGHGASGWALACGSARLLADALVGRPSVIDVEGLGIGRLKD